MKAKWLKFLSLLCAVAFIGAITAPDADARRLGGGRSFGKSFGSVTKPSAAPAAGNYGTRRAGKSRSGGSVLRK